MIKCLCGLKMKKLAHKLVGGDARPESCDSLFHLCIEYLFKFQLCVNGSKESKKRKRPSRMSNLDFILYYFKSYVFKFQLKLKAFFVPSYAVSTNRRTNPTFLAQ
jgi:hypothetical protein